jgi:hypothetical protein
MAARIARVCLAKTSVARAGRSSHFLARARTASLRYPPTQAGKAGGEYSSPLGRGTRRFKAGLKGSKRGQHPTASTVAVDARLAADRDLVAGAGVRPEALASVAPFRFERLGIPQDTNPASVFY